MSRILTLGILLATAACGTRQLYEGPSRPSGEVSVIRAYIPKPSTGAPGDEAYDVRMVGVDDIEFDDFLRNVEVLPGKHRVHLLWEKWRIDERWGGFYGSDAEIPYWKRIGAGRRTMEIKVEAGRKVRLIVPWEESGRDWYFEDFGQPLGKRP